MYLGKVKTLDPCGFGFVRFGFRVSEHVGFLKGFDKGYEAQGLWRLEPMKLFRAFGLGLRV